VGITQQRLHGLIDHSVHDHEQWSCFECCGSVLEGRARRLLFLSTNALTGSAASLEAAHGTQNAVDIVCELSSLITYRRAVLHLVGALLQEFSRKSAPTFGLWKALASSSSRSGKPEYPGLLSTVGLPVHVADRVRQQVLDYTAVQNWVR
jgi:hypothetical protein